MAGRTRSRSVTYGQLMLFAALLFGIVTMHTVGHPAEHGGSAATSAASASSSASPAAMGEHSSPHGSPGADAPMSGLDPLSVCLAVLGVWGLTLVGSWLLGLRPDGRPLGTPVGAGFLRVLRPNPPPPIPVLASVSVLRI
ncbi:hypothetical protein JHN55_27460 [Streptomyces sp. MBT56]|uniref:DUF6153 family protein n=1 Tax=unclassified Streptomyces TaxID=2593676 RepID=UPI00190AB9BA|nr:MULTISPECIES: DUF6153 family protein [unclassified Streptomyces]MBK3560197.1 hypothetical protein [Streptomyces sp. MBT56]MBK3603820.1 hypothetical protein [Streptomyces sp. MBT54]MBK3616563.1 hypothetical protein [Streptomyces sp. MBT98]MBK6045887.1 hypothetical protein [Streptomyces sp. MBT55]